MQHKVLCCGCCGTCPQETRGGGGSNETGAAQIEANKIRLWGWQLLLGVGSASLGNKVYRCGEEMEIFLGESANSQEFRYSVTASEIRSLS